MSNNILRTIIFILAVSGFAFGQAADNAAGDVKKALETYDKAWNSKDVKTVGAMLDDGYVYFSSIGGLTNKKSTVEFLAKPDYKLTFVERSEISVHKYDGKVAILSSRWKGKGTWSGGEINDDQRCGQVFTREKSGWKLVSEHCVQIAAK